MKDLHTNTRVFAKGTNLEIQDYAYTTSCKLPPYYTQLKYHGISSIKWYFNSQLVETFNFDKATNYQNCFVGDKCYYPGYSPGCFSLNSVGEHIIKLEAYPGRLISSSFVPATPPSSISKEIYVVDCNGINNITSQSTLDGFNGYIIDGNITIKPLTGVIDVNSGEKLTIDTYNKATFESTSGTIHFKSGSSVKIVAKDCPSVDCDCDPLKSALIKDNSIQSLFNDHVIVYPNPVDDYAVINLGEIYENVSEIKLVDLSGKIIYNQDCNFEPIVYVNMNGLIQGMYFVHIKCEDGMVVKKIIKN